MNDPNDPLSKLEQTQFRRALAASGLVDGLVLHRVAVEVAGMSPESPEAQDGLYADRLIKLDRLNAWQVEQLKQGRTKFTLGPYRILDAIGSGGMGYVFLGEHDLLGRVEAIKVLPRSKTTPEAIANFRHEIRSQAQLDHPNLVRVSYADRDGETYFLVTEYVPGIDLRRLIRRGGPLDESLAAWVVSEAAKGIHYAHQNRLVHRDVKPGNVLLTTEGDVKVTDLGLAWSLESGGAGGRTRGRDKVVGTSDYLAPEAIKKPGDVSALGDIYSLGCTLYYAVTGKVPYPGGNHVNKMRRHVHEAPADPRRFNKSLSDEVLQLIFGMMEKDPDRRITSAEVVAEELSRLLDQSEPRRLALLIEAVSKDAERDTDPSSKESSGDEQEPADQLPETVGITIDASAEITPECFAPPKAPPAPPLIAEPSAAPSPANAPRLRDRVAALLARVFR